MAQANEQERVRAVTVVGGGSAGWIAACRVAARNPDIRVRLIESDTIPTIGVGEGTWPTMRNTLAKIGLRETDFIRGCDAAFKQGARFAGWTTGAADDAYYHPLNPPAGAADLDLSPHWLDRPDDDAATDFAEWVDYQQTLCEAGLAPKSITMAEYAGHANYAYHLDAGKFAAMLREHAVDRLGVEHIVGDVARSVVTDGGDIERLELADGRAIGGDLFIDCTGFAALLIGGVYQIPFRRCGDVLFADRAIALQLPYESEDDPIACHTIATAQTAGWIWDIGLWTRRGIGHVYSSAHISDDEAELALRRYAGPSARDLSARRIRIDGGYRTTFWKNNCVAVGLSAGFIEPLEASALMLIEASMDAIADRLPQTRRAMEVAARQFNTTFEHHWERIIEFLKLHYALTKRTDSDFWRDHADPRTMPADLADRIDFWRDHAPSLHDFPQAREVFAWPSYQYILHGMRSEARYAAAAGDAVSRQRTRLERIRSDAVRQLPKHRDLLRAVREHGLQVT